MSIYGTYGKRCPLVATIIAVAREDERQGKKGKRKKTSMTVLQVSISDLEKKDTAMHIKR